LVSGEIEGYDEDDLVVPPEYTGPSAKLLSSYIQAFSGPKAKETKKTSTMNKSTSTGRSDKSTNKHSSIATTMNKGKLVAMGNAAASRR
jgi:hypothetical protein